MLQYFLSPFLNYCLLHKIAYINDPLRGGKNNLQESIVLAQRQDTSRLLACFKHREKQPLGRRKRALLLQSATPNARQTQERDQELQ